MIFESSYGFRNKAEKLLNNIDTKFAIASGTKMFTGLGVCKLIDEGKLSLSDKIGDILNVELGKINKEITVLQLLTHTSGVADYIDEENDDLDGMLVALYEKYPCYLWENMDYYLQMSTDLEPKFSPGERFGYSNTGYVLLGLIIESVSGMSYQKYITENIIEPSGLLNTGFYRMDTLPENTTLGYILYEETEVWQTNVFSVPVIGGSDGGLFTTVEDLNKLWHNIFANNVLTEEMTMKFLEAHVPVEDDDSEFYGLGVYQLVDGEKKAYFTVGADAGVGFLSCYFVSSKTVITAMRNFMDFDNYDLMWKLMDVLGQ